MSLAPARTPQPNGFADRLEAFAAVQAREGADKSVLERVARFRAGMLGERDAISTWLMETYKATGSKEAFTLLYELNHEDFLRLIYHHLRRAYYPVDPADILQEVFFNVYRYPFKFKPDRSSAFRNWTHSIIRNTVLKHSRRAQRDRVLPIGVQERDTDDPLVIEPADENASTPFDSSAEREATTALTGSWMLYLSVYLEAYRCLTPREKRVLFLVEVDSLPYREAADRVGVRVENLKMMVFRARRKIYSIMKRKFQASEDEAGRILDRRDHGHAPACVPVPHVAPIEPVRSEP